MKCSSQVQATNGIVAAAAGAAAAAALAFGCFAFVPQAHAVTAAEKAAEAEAALTQLTAMQETLEEKSSAYLEALQSYEAAVSKRDATQKRIDEISKEIDEVQGRLGNRARDMYRNGSTSFIDLLLGATSFDEFTKNWDLLNRVNETDAELSSKARALRTETEEQEKILTEQAKVAQQKSDEASEAFEEAETLVNQMQETYDSLSAEAQALYAQEQAAYATTGGVVNDDGTVTDIETGQVYESANAYTAATGNAIVDRARAAIGSNYVWGGVGGSDGGYDCSGLVSWALTGQNTRIGTSSSFGQYQRVTNPQPGDVYVGTGHVGIYTGSSIIHAKGDEYGVVEDPVPSDGYFVHVG